MGSTNSKEKELNEDIAESTAKFFKAAKEGRIADVKLVLQHAPERVNEQNRVLLLLHTRTLLIMAVGQYAETALHEAAAYNSLEVAEVLVAANANVDIKTKVRAGCS